MGFQADDGARDKCVSAAGTFLFLFSSRRRHTRSLCDWSSDVCSSDLACDERREYLPLITGIVPRAASDEVAQVILELGHRSRAGFEPFLGKDRLQSAEEDRKSVV